MAAEHVMLLDELHAANLEAELDLWRHLLQMDLTATIKAEVRRTRRADEVGPRRTRARRRSAAVTDFLWLRILDVAARARASATYEHDGELVLEVTDDLDGDARSGRGSLPAHRPRRHGSLRANGRGRRPHDRRPRPVGGVTSAGTRLDGREPDAAVRRAPARRACAEADRPAPDGRPPVVLDLVLIRD